MTKLSVNVNKIATLRNARGGTNPDVVKCALDCERFGAQGITVHPRPDERHITYNDVMNLKDVIKTEFNIEGFPDKRYLGIVESARPTQATLVPDGPDVLTSCAGWDTIKHHDFLLSTVNELKALGSRVSIFVDPEPQMVEGAKAVGADRIELYTEPYARCFAKDENEAIKDYVMAAKLAQEIDLGINAGHDLDLNNLKFLKESIPYIDEVSIGHALISDALYYGLENTIQMYLRKLDTQTT